MTPTSELDTEAIVRGDGQEVQIPAGPVLLPGTLRVPIDHLGVVLFAHGSGSGRHSPRNRFVAEALHRQKLATVLIDLLTPPEAEADEQAGLLRFDVRLLAERLIGATDWLRRSVPEVPIGYFGGSTGAAAALVAAAERPGVVGAVVSRGGRPDLAGADLPRVRAPTLLLVGGADPTVLTLNEDALVDLGATAKELEVIPGATHLFEEPGALEKVARLAARWFLDHLRRV